MKTLFIFLFLVGTCLCLKAGADYSVIIATDNTWDIVEGFDPNYYAYGVYYYERNLTGWDVFQVQTNPALPDDQTAFAAGYLEGALTQEVVWDAWLTFWNGTMNFEYPAVLENWLESNDKWVRSMVSSSKKGELQGDDQDYWTQVGLVLDQFDGICAGYLTTAPDSQYLPYKYMLLYQASTDIGDIQATYNLSTYIPKNSNQYLMKDHCSVLVKVLPDGSDLYSSHVTWSGFDTMLRIYKHYNTPFQAPSTKASSASFSSYPGQLPSVDDFYITNTNLVVMETTNNIFNQTLYNDYITTESVLYWIRIIVANRMSSSGSEWVKWFAMYNSGTYNNQWIVVDNKLFSPGQPLQPNTLWIAEQIPGFVVSADKSDVLQKTGYWASYNIPYFPFIYNVSGYPKMYKENGNGYSYSKCPRAQIFARDHGTVTSLETMKRIMRYNKWQTDPLSLQDPCNGISARCDLGLNPTAFGGIDCKITDITRSPSMQSEAVSSPTWDSQPVFNWNSEWEGVAHYGEPDIWDFEFVTMAPNYREL